MESEDNAQSLAKDREGENKWISSSYFFVNKGVPGTENSLSTADALQIPDHRKFSNEFESSMASWNEHLGSTLRKLVDDELMQNLSSSSSDYPGDQTYIATYNEIDWDCISKQILSECEFDKPHGLLFSPFDCYRMYRNVYDSNINNDAWKSDELESLLSLVRKYNLHYWSTIAEELGTNRTPLQCLKEFQMNHNPSINTHRRSDEEDETIQNINDTNGATAETGSFKILRKRSRTHHDAQLRILNDDAPHLWLASQQKRLFLAAIACDASTRVTANTARLDDNAVAHTSSDQISNTRNTGVRDTDHRIGEILANCVGDKGAKVCKHYWIHRLNPALNLSPFSSSEDEMIVNLALNASKPIDWTVIAKHLPGRSSGVIAQRWKKLSRKIQTDVQTD